VYIISETRLFREGLKGMLIREGGLDVVGHGSCADALEEIGPLRPASLLLDMAGRDCLAVPRKLHAILPDLQIVAVAVTELESDIIACAEAGISGYVAQHGTVEDLIATIKRALGGELICPPRIAALLFNRVATLAADRPSSPLDEALTRREREIAGLIAAGLQNKEIARRLGLGNATVKNHVHNILQKLNIQRRGEIMGRRFDTDPWRGSAAVTPVGRLQSYLRGGLRT
jgi:two-component system, NarL family, nitrate/nitrite response regulator NarL